MRTTPEQRFWAKVIRRGEDECWSWTGSPNNAGYGTMSVSSERVGAHRFAYQLLVGPIPEGYDVDHICHNEDPTCRGFGPCRHRLCVNPKHLRAVTREENVLQGKWTHCKRGHEFTPENTRERYGARWCRACDAERAQKYRGQRAQAGRL